MTALTMPERLCRASRASRFLRILERTLKRFALGVPFANPLVHIAAVTPRTRETANVSGLLEDVDRLVADLA
jgi:hypothetical protein